MKTLTHRPTGKVLAVLLAFVMMLSTLTVGLSVIASAVVKDLPASATLEDGTVYKVTANTTIQGTTAAAAVKIPANATVIIDIASGVTLTVKGGNASGTSAGNAGILLQTGSKLIITGSGTLDLYGGNGSSGANGSNSTSANNSTSAGANGGAGGAGGGAGIGTNGGAGGNANGGSGSSYGAWPNNASVTIAGSVTVQKHNGSNGSAGSNGTQGTGNGSGGAGGGGGAGKAGQPFGTGGGGGNGGGKGTDGYTSGTCTTSYNKGTNGSKGGDGADSQSKTYTTSNPFTAMADAISANSDYYGKTMAELVAIDGDILQAVYDALYAPYDPLISTYGQDTYDYYFGDYDTETLLENLAAAKAMAANIALAQWLQTKSGDEVDYNASYDVLNMLWSEFNTKYEAYQDLTEDVRGFLEEEGYIDVAAVEAKLNEYKFAMDVANLRENYYDLITGDVSAFSAYDRDWVAETDGATGLISAAKLTLETYTSLLNGMDQNAVSAVFGEDYVTDTIAPVYDSVCELMYASELKDEFAGYKSVYNSALAPVDLAGSDASLYNVLNSYDSWYSDLQDYVDELREFDNDFADKVLGDLYGAMQAKINSIYTTLAGRITARIETAYDNYMNFVSVYGYTINTSDEINVQNYTALRQVFNNINTTQYNFLVNTPNYTVPQEIQDKYNAIKNALFAYENFDATKGLSAYEYNKIKVEDINRVLTDYDEIRDMDYTIDGRAKRATVYENVKSLLDSDLVKGLIGDSFDLASLSDTVKGFIFSDSLINTLISMIYPIVIDNFAPVWATQLPDYFPHSQSGMDFNFPIKQNLCTLRQALDKLGLYAMPNQLAAQSVMNAFPEIKAKLAAVTYDPVYDAAEGKVTVNPWNDPSLVDEDGKLALEWGVHDKDSFINALSAGLAGVEPILLALLSNKTTNKSINIVGDGKRIADSDSILFITVEVVIDPITLNMSFRGNDGFNNALAPILSVLGADTIGDGKQMTTLRKLATGIATPFDEIINKLAADPIDFLLKALPNLAFAVDYGLIEPLLANLKETITYSAVAHYTPSQCADPGDITAVEQQEIAVDVGDLLLGGLGLDFSTPSGFINSIVGLIGGDDEGEGEGEGEGEEASGGIADLLAVLPLEDLFQKLAYLGDSVTWKTGYRSVSPYTFAGHTADFPYIEATASEVFSYLVDYILNLLKTDENLLPDLVNALGLDVDLEDEDDLIVSIIKNIIEDPENAIAAIVELMIPVDYGTDGFKEYEWAESTLTYNVPALDASDVAYLKYANSWGQEEAAAVVDGGLLDQLMPLLGQEGTLNDLLAGLIGGAFTNDNIQAIVDAIASLGASEAPEEPADPGNDGDGEGDPATDPEEPAAEDKGLDVVALLKDALGIDLSVYSDGSITWDEFEDGDVDGFFNALKEVVAPFNPLIALLFGQDFSALDGIINVIGYDTYPYSIKQLFTALDIAQIPENTAPDAALNAIIDSVGAKVAALLQGNVLKNLLGILPNLVYFIDSNGLATLVYNLLLPIEIIFEIIRPIYPIDLDSLIAGLLPEGVTLSLSELTFGNILPLVDNMLGTNLAGTPLATYTIPALYAGRITGDFSSSIAETDVLTILLSGLIEAIEAPSATEDLTNGQVIFAKLGEQAADIYTKIFTIFTDEESSVEKINWSYMLDEIQLDSFDMPDNTESIINILSYDNDWTPALAAYLDDNLDTIVGFVLDATGNDAGFLTTLIKGLLNDNLYTKDLANKLIEAIGGAVSGLDTALVDVANLMLGTEITDDAFKPLGDDVTINDSASFIAAVVDALEPVYRLLDFVLLGESYKFLYASTGEDLLAIKGGEAYNAALVPVFEALGVDMPKSDTFADAEDCLTETLTAVAARLDEIADDPINEILELLPNVLYFINAGGVKAAVNNTLAPFENIIKLAMGFMDDEYDGSYLIPEIEINEDLSIDITNITMDTVIELVEGLTDLEFTDGTKNVLTEFYIGRAEYYESANGLPAFRMVYNTTTTRADMLTLLASFIIENVLAETSSGKTNGEIILDMLEKPEYLDLYTDIVTIATGQGTYTTDKFNWDYMYDEDQGEDFELPEDFTEQGIINYLSYRNEWNEDVATYLDENLEDIIAEVLEATGNDADFLTTLIKGMLNDKVYTKDLVNSLISALNGALSNLDSQILGLAAAALGAEIPAGGFALIEDEITDSEGFINAVADTLAPAGRLLSFVLFGQEYKFLNSSTGEDLITVKGTYAYNFALVPLFEALGVDMPAADTFKNDEGKYDADYALRTVLAAVAARIDEIAEDPINNILELLPNLIYFINADGIKVAVNNTLAPFEAVLKLVMGDSYDGTLNITVKEGVSVDIKDLTTANILSLIEGLTGLKFTEGSKRFLPAFYIGGIEKYPSASGLPAYRLVYPDGSNARRDMITILAAFLIENIKYEDNIQIFKDVLDDNVYTAISNMLSIKNVDMKPIDWLYKEAANTDQTFSGISTSKIFDGYGPLFTREMAEYIADHLQEFVDDLIQILGIQIDGEFVLSLDELLDNVVGNSIYTTANAEKVLGAIKDAIGRIDTLPAANRIKDVIKLSLGVDLAYYDTFEITPFADGDRDGFLAALIGSVEPLYRVLTWLLCDDTIAFFVDTAGNDEIVLPGAEGYKFGIGPILEALDCKNIPSQAQVNAATDAASLITLIATPVLDRIDEILDNPVDEIFEILPNIAYFVNSKGLDTSLKNLLNAVYTLLDALSPILPAGFSIDSFITNMLGRPLADVDMQYLLDMIVSAIASGTDETLQTLVIDAVAEMTTGKIVSYDSMTGFDAYKMVYNGKAAKADTVTIILRLALKWIATGDNPEKLKTIIREKVDMSEEGYKYTDCLIDTVAEYCVSAPGTDAILHALYYIFYGLQNGTADVADWLTSYNGRVQMIEESLGESRSTVLVALAEFLDELYTGFVDPEGTTGEVYSDHGIASNGFISFFKQIIEWFRTIFAKIKALFS